MGPVSGAAVASGPVPSRPVPSRGGRGAGAAGPGQRAGRAAREGGVRGVVGGAGVGSARWSGSCDVPVSGKSLGGEKGRRVRVKLKGARRLPLFKLECSKMV